MDGTGHTSDYADHYYAKIRGKITLKNIVIDVDTRMILNYCSELGVSNKIHNLKLHQLDN